jgi:hypothetical protein
VKGINMTRPGYKNYLPILCPSGGILIVGYYKPVLKMYWRLLGEGVLQTKDQLLIYRFSALSIPIPIAIPLFQ